MPTTPNPPTNPNPNDNLDRELLRDITHLVLNGKIRAALYNGELRFYHADHPLPPNAIPIDPDKFAKSIDRELFGD